MHDEERVAQLLFELGECKGVLKDIYQNIIQPAPDSVAYHPLAMRIKNILDLPEISQL